MARYKVRWYAFGLNGFHQGLDIALRHPLRRVGLLAVERSGRIDEGSRHFARGLESAVICYFGRFGMTMATIPELSEAFYS